jgi:hypothetical protein
MKKTKGSVPAKASPMQKQIESIHEIRHALREMANSILESRPSLFTDLAVASLRLSSMWCGKLLGTFGSIDPYPKSRNPASGIIEPDGYDGERKLTRYSDPISEIKNLRKICSEQLIVLNDVCTDASTYDIDAHQLFIGALNATNHLTEAGMWLGMELGTMKDPEYA